MNMVRMIATIMVIVSPSWASCPNLTGLWKGTCPADTEIRYWGEDMKPKSSSGILMPILVKVSQSDDDCHHLEFDFRQSTVSDNIKLQKYQIGNPIVDFELKTKNGQRTAEASSSRLNWENDVLVLTTNTMHNWQFDSKEQSVQTAEQRKIVKLSLSDNNRLHVEKVMVIHSTLRKSNVPYFRTLTINCDLDKE